MWYVDIHDVPDSESLKVKLTLDTANPAVTLSVERVVIVYGWLLHTSTDVTSGLYVEYAWDGLEHSTTYYWQVIVFDVELFTAGPEWEFTTAGALLGDLDGDGDVDLDDFNLFADCMNGPTIAYSPNCDGADFDSDGDVDLADFGRLQDEFTGSGN